MSGNRTLYNITIADLVDSATQLNDAQTALSMQTVGLTGALADDINP